MAQKKITDLALRSDFDETCNVPVDDATQTFRTTGQQISDFIGTQSHAAKVWALVDSAGAAADSYNVSSITDSGAGDMTVNFTTAFSSVNYSSLLTIMEAPGGTQATTFVGQVQSAGKTVSAQPCSSLRVSDGNGIDPTYYNFAAFGEQ
jgi:hypothetical protein